MANKPQVKLKCIKGYGNNFKKLRELNNLTQMQLSEQINFSDKVISLIEKEEREPTNEQLNAYCDRFNVSLDYLTGRTKAISATVQMICEFTGLSEKALLSLRSHLMEADDLIDKDASERMNKRITEPLSIILQTTEIYDLIIALRLLQNESSKEMSAEADDKCDMLRYRVSKYMEKICDKFDRRNNDG